MLQPLTAQSAGAILASENVPVTSVTVADNTVYWVAGTQVTADSLSDTTGGAGKVLLPSVPFGGVSITDLAVDPSSNLFRGLECAPGTAGSLPSIRSHRRQGAVPEFPGRQPDANDVAIDGANGTYRLAASTAGLPPLIARYPLTPNANGTLFAFANSTVYVVTVAGDHVYWIDGQSVWSENLNGTGLTLQETLPAQFTPTDLAVSLNAPAAVPEAGTSAMLGSGLVFLGLIMRRRQRPKQPSVTSASRLPERVSL